MLRQQDAVAERAAEGAGTKQPAGIDLSPSLAMALGIDGMGKVAWRLVS